MATKSAKSAETQAVKPRSAGGWLDVIVAVASISGVKTMPMKVVGQLRKTPWQRFARLQATAALLAKGKGQRKGVFRFASHEECAQWTASQTKG